MAVLHVTHDLTIYEACRLSSFFLISRGALFRLEIVLFDSSSLSIILIMEMNFMLIDLHTCMGLFMQKALP